MAGMEQRFEKGLRDGLWSKPLLAFVKNDDVNSLEHIGRLMEKALCAEYRAGEFPFMIDVIREFQEIYFQLGKAHQWDLFILGANEITLLRQYQARCARYLAEASQNPHLYNLEAVIDLGYDHLEAACHERIRLKASPKEAGEKLMTAFFRKHVIGKMAPACDLRVHRHGHSPEEVFLRQGEALSFLPFGKIVTQAIQGKTKIIASRTKRPTIRLTDSVVVGRSISVLVN